MPKSAKDKKKDKGKQDAKDKKPSTGKKSLQSLNQPFNAPPPSDTLTIKVYSLRTHEKLGKNYMLNVAYNDLLIISEAVRPTKALDFDENTEVIAEGVFNYDPWDVEKMCKFADTPLTVQILPMKSTQSKLTTSTTAVQTKLRDISCCNVDILPIFIDKDKMVVKKRMEPLVKPRLLHQVSWENLPLLTMEISVDRKIENAAAHEVLKQVNNIKLTLISGFNMIVPLDCVFNYIGASMLPVQTYKGMRPTIVMYNNGLKEEEKSNSKIKYIDWESVKREETFSKCDETISYEIEDIYNPDRINLDYYINIESSYNVVWQSFHRHLLFEDDQTFLRNHFRHWNWLVEIHLYSDRGGYSFMGFLDLSRLLETGKKRLLLAVPLQWISLDVVKDKTGGGLLLTPASKPIFSVSSTATQKGSRNATPCTMGSGDATSMSSFMKTGADGCPAFILIEVKLEKPLYEINLPRFIPDEEIRQMLRETEENAIKKRHCYGRSESKKKWTKTLMMANNALRRVPYYGATEMCKFNRQFSETRTRLELSASFLFAAAKVINNNFLIADHIEDDKSYEEMLIMAHIILMNTTHALIIGVEEVTIEPILRAARQARQLQDLKHAVELYLECVSNNYLDADLWRELSTCLKDLDMDWAAVCLETSLLLNPRDPLTLISYGSLIFEDNQAAAEPFFLALITYYPFWPTAWVIAHVYFAQRDLYNLSDKILEYERNILEQRMCIEYQSPREWNYELGDWWENIPLLPGTSRYYFAADLLLRLRCIQLAEICVARGLLESGETSVYFFMLSLCCRLRGDIEMALCHIRDGIEKLGEVACLRTLQAECLHQKKDLNGVQEAFEKADVFEHPFNILLSVGHIDLHSARNTIVQLLQKQPSAYGWIALADNWLKRLPDLSEDNEDYVVALTCAAACAIQANRWDKRAAKAWAILARIVRPRARRSYCKMMASYCGYNWRDNKLKLELSQKDSCCYILGEQHRECHCCLCDPLYCI